MLVGHLFGQHFGEHFDGCINRGLYDLSLMCGKDEVEYSGHPHFEACYTELSMMKVLALSFSVATQIVHGSSLFVYFQLAQTSSTRSKYSNDPNQQSPIQS